MKSIKLNFLIFFIIAVFLSCEDYYNKRVVFTLQSIVADRTVVAYGESVNLSAVISIQGMVNQNEVNYTWDCSDGVLSDRTKQATIWTAPSDHTGEFLIRLKVTFMGNTEEGEIAIKVVRTPAANWGSLSGNILNNMKVPVPDVIVSTITGESDTTDITGFFYIENVPQGATGLEFTNLGFKWTMEPLNTISIAGGNHQHLGDIIFYESTPPDILSYDKNPDWQTIITIQQNFSTLYNYFELYISYKPDGSDHRRVASVPSNNTIITLKEERDSAYVALKSVPLQGVSSDFSSWTKIYFAEVIDPDADRSSIEYSNFFSATITWVPTGYEEYYKGFRLAEENDTGFTFISPVLPVSTFQYNLETIPGMTGNYYVIAIMKSGKYNTIQPAGQRISLSVPFMEYPAGFKGTIQTIGNTSVILSWQPVSSNNTWYSGYVIKKKTIIETSESEWEDLIFINNSFTATYTDAGTEYGNIYKYSIRSISYPAGFGAPAYSEDDSITVEDLWNTFPFSEITDPDADMSFFTYNNFYSATLSWQAAGYENYYKGFRIAREDELSGIVFISPILSVSTFSYNIGTKPGMTANYYVVAITETGDYNDPQPESQKIKLEVPSMKFPEGFKGRFQTTGGVSVRLTWEPVANDNIWYSGYLIEKKTIIGSIENDWEELTRITNSFTDNFMDIETDTTNIYKYSIRSISYPSFPGSPEYSSMDIITIEYK